MFLHIKDIDKLPKLQKDKSVDHIIIVDHKGKLNKNPPSPNDYEIIKLNSQTKNNKKGDKNKWISQNL